MSYKITCIAKEGFPYVSEHGTRGLIGRHQQVDLPRADFEKLHAQGLVLRPEEFAGLVEQGEQHTQAEADAQLADGQAQFDKARAERAKLVRQREEAMMQDEIKRAERQAELVKQNVKKRREILGHDKQAS